MNIYKLTILCYCTLICLILTFNQKVSANNFKEFYQRYNSSICLIQSEEVSTDGTNKIISYGTAFPIADNGILLTSAHLVKNGSIIKTPKGNFLDIQSIIWKDKQKDLALIKINEFLNPLPLEQISEEEIGEDLLIISNPAGFQNTLSAGILSSIRTDSSFFDKLQYTNPISPGSSGAPILNSKGKVIGIVQGIYTGQYNQNLNFGIPIKYIPHKYLETNLSQTFSNKTPEHSETEAYYRKIINNLQPESDEDYILRALLKQKLKDYLGAIKELQNVRTLVSR